MPATNFDELITLMAEEAPHAVALDWYRRLELALRDYAASQSLVFHNGPRAERLIAADRVLGPRAAATVVELRTIRNRLTHEWHPFAPAEAEAFARKAFSLIGRVLRATEARAT